MSDAYDIPASPVLGNTPTKQMFTHREKTPLKTPVLKKKAGFQLYLLQERGTISAKYPFLTPQQIKSKVSDSWSKLSSAEKSKYKPNKPSPQTPKTRKNLKDKVAAFRSPGHCLKTPKQYDSHADFTPPRGSVRDRTKLHPVALKKSLLFVTKKQKREYEKKEKNEKPAQESVSSDESLTLQMSQESRHYGSGNHMATKIMYKAPKIVEDVPTWPKNSILRARETDKAKADNRSKSTGRVSFGENDEKVIERQRYLSSQDSSEPSFSPLVNDGPSQWIKEHRQKLKPGPKKVNRKPPLKIYKRVKSDDPFSYSSSTDSDMFSDDFVDVRDDGKENSHDSDSEDERDCQLLSREEDFQQVKEKQSDDEDEDVAQLDPPQTETDNACKEEKDSITKQSEPSKETKAIIEEARELIKRCMKETNEVAEALCDDQTVGTEEKKFKTPNLNTRPITRYLKKSGQTANKSNQNGLDANQVGYTNILDSDAKSVEYEDDDDVTPLMSHGLLKEKLQSALKQPRKRKRSEVFDEKEDKDESRPSSAKKCIIEKESKSVPKSKGSHKRFKNAMCENVPEERDEGHDDNLRLCVESESLKEDENRSQSTHKHDRRQPTLENFFAKKNSLDAVKPKRKPVESINKHDSTTSKKVSQLESEAISDEKPREDTKEEAKQRKRVRTCMDSERKSDEFVKPSPRVKRAKTKTITDKDDSLPSTPDDIFGSLTGAGLMFDDASSTDEAPAPPHKSTTVVDRTIMVLRELGSPILPQWTDDDNSRMSFMDPPMSPAMSGISQLSHVTSIDDVADTRALLPELAQVKSDEKLPLAKVISPNTMYGTKLVKPKITNEAADIKANEPTIDEEPLSENRDPQIAFDTKKVCQTRATKILENLPSDSSEIAPESSLDQSIDLPDVVPAERKRPKAPRRSYSKSTKNNSLMDLFDEISPQDVNTPSGGSKRRLVSSSSKKEDHLNDVMLGDEFFA